MRGDVDKARHVESHMEDVRVDKRFKHVVYFEVAELLQESHLVQGLNKKVLFLALLRHLDVDRGGCEYKQRSDGHLLGEVLVLLHKHQHHEGEHRVGSDLQEGL